MLYQLSNGKVVYLSIDEYLDLTDLDIQYLISLDYGDSITDPFSGSAINTKEKEVFYDFNSLSEDDDGITIISLEDLPFDDIADISGPLDN